MAECASNTLGHLRLRGSERYRRFARRFSQRSRVAMAWFSRPFARISSAHARFSGDGTTPSTALATASMKNVETPICLCRLLGLCPARVHHGTIRPAIAVRTLATSSIGGAQFTMTQATASPRSSGAARRGYRASFSPSTTRGSSRWIGSRAIHGSTAARRSTCSPRRDTPARGCTS